MNRAKNPVEIDSTNRPAEADELNFDENESTSGFGEHESATATVDDSFARNAGLTEASQPGQGPTNDDLTLETMILEDGARSQHEHEQGNFEPADKSLSIVNDKEIGGGSGLDEAELAQTEPPDKRKSSREK